MNMDYLTDKFSLDGKVALITGCLLYTSFISQHARQQQKHHHTAACADKSTDETDHNAAQYGLDQLLPHGLGFLCVFGREDRSH